MRRILLYYNDTQILNAKLNISVTVYLRLVCFYGSKAMPSCKVLAFAFFEHPHKIEIHVFCLLYLHLYTILTPILTY